MADTRLSDLASASALSASDLFYVVQSAGSGGEKATGTQLLTLVGTTYVAKSGGTMTGALTLPAGSASAPSLLFTGAGATTGIFATGATGLSIASSGVAVVVFNNSTTRFRDASSSDAIILEANTAFVGLGTANDVRFGRDAAGVLAQRNGTNAQTLRVYGTYTDSSNYERLSLSTTAGSSVNISAETLGTGGDNLDIVLTPAGTGKVLVPATSPSLAIAGNPTYGLGWDAASGVVLVHASTKVLTTRTGGLGMPSTGFLAWSQGTIGETLDAGFSRGAAGQVDVTNGTAGAWRDLKLRNLIQTKYHELTEMTAPSAPATNSVRIYAEDNGSGKTRLMALFATGAAQQLAIEP